MVDQASAQGESLITLQQLVDVNMRVKTTSMGQPSVAVDLKVRDQPSRQGIQPETRLESFEMSPGVLEVMLEGFGRIRDQLTQV
mmetsp:Transcript_20719/g.26819  ORF Transcript_20719/g.26819 Transcript_20719/m.26819 type:complete len:84 (-) Transcript_20719:7-258(-)